MNKVWSDHIRIDERSLAMHKKTAEKIRKDPSLLDIAKENLERWGKQYEDPPDWWKEWKRILGKPLNEILEFITSWNEESRRLRQSSPFCGILTEEERSRLLEEYSIKNYYKN